MVSYPVEIYTQDLVFTGPQVYSSISQQNPCPVVLPNLQIMIGLPVDMERMNLSQLLANRKASRKGKVRCYHKW
jgi:hypothetical protein